LREFVRHTPDHTQHPCFCRAKTQLAADLWALKRMISELFARNVYIGIWVFGHAMFWKYLSLLTLEFTMRFTLQSSTPATSLSQSVLVGFDQSGRNCMHSRWSSVPPDSASRTPWIMSLRCDLSKKRCGDGFSDGLRYMGDDCPVLWGWFHKPWLVGA